jgi:hypothetical protein
LSTVFSVILKLIYVSDIKILVPVLWKTQCFFISKTSLLMLLGKSSAIAAIFIRTTYGTACEIQGFVVKHLGHIRYRALNGWLNVGKVITIFSVVCGWNIMTPFSTYSAYHLLPTA